ncbi:MAG: type II toxin-antitoxin system VapC family toxin [Acidobacteriota bacterium]
MIVVDVNIILHALTATPQNELARQLRRRDSDWLAPPLWRHEMLNVLATLTRQEVLARQSALTVWQNALDLMAAREQPPDMEHAFSLAIAHGISAYDAQYIALAESLDVLMVSEDRKLNRLLPQRVISLAQALA